MQAERRESTALASDPRFARGLAVAAIVLTVPGLLGWLFGIPWLVQPFGAFAPARLGGTVMIITGAAGLLAKLAGRRSRARVLAVLCALAALLAMVVAWRQVSLPLDSLARARVGDFSPLRAIPTSAALLFLLYGAALYCLASVSQSVRRRAVAGALSALLVASSGVLLLAQLAGMLGADGAAETARAPLHSLLAALLLGTALLQRNMSDDERTNAPPRWAAVLAGASTLLLVLVIWQALVARELSQARDRSEVV